MVEDKSKVKMILSILIRLNKVPKIKATILISAIFSLFFIIGTSAGDVGDEKHYRLALKLLQEGKYHNAESILSLGIKKYPKAAKLYFLRGDVRHTYAKRYIEAIQDYTVVIKLDIKNNPKVLWRRGDSFYEIGIYQQAIKDYSSCLHMLPKYGKVHLKRAKAWGKLGMIHNAIRDIQMAVRYDPKYEAEAQRLLNNILTSSDSY